MQKLTGKMRAAIQQYKMISDKDKIAVGVSGGKDSLILLLGLHSLKRYYPLKFNITAITVDPGFNNTFGDYSKIQNLCNELNIEYIVKRTTIADIIFNKRKEKNPCSLCAKMRRGILHNLAKEHNCTKVALGHHLDDAVETFFMNLFNGGSISCFSPKAYLSEKDIYLIRPMIYCTENELNRACKKYNLPVVKSLCPVNEKTEREKTKQFIKTLEKDFPDLKKKIIGAIKRKNISKW